MWNAWRSLSGPFQRSFSERADPSAVNARTAADQGIPISPGRGYRRRVEFRVLGSIELFEEGIGPIALGGPKQRAVLANLLLRANHLVPADVLIDEVWGDEPPETARNALQSYASHLRKALGAERLEGSRAGYRLRAEPSELDAARFQSLLRDARRLLPIDARAAVGAFDHALALWRGPAFADLAGEPSLRAEAARLDDLRLGAVEDRIEAHLTLGDYAEVIGELEGLTARHPLRERFWEQLMLALYRSGRQAEALAAFQRAREILADELGIDPSPELRRLHERILAQSPDLDASGEPLRGYRLLERLGEDPFGVLFRATQPNVGREVAVRAAHEHRANDPMFIRRFDAEAQAVAALEHPHVAPVYDYWREPGRAYVVTRFLRGGSLRDLIERPERLPIERATRILEQIASALSAAHRRAVAHGNLGPSNVLFDEEGNAYLSDFSIGNGRARMVDDVRAFAALARETLGERLPIATDDAIRRAEDAKDPDQASSLLSEVVATLGPGTRATVDTEIRNPYKGLRPFLESDTADFFGREAFVERLLERLSRRGNGARFVAVVGPSGSGKSSVVSAGLVAAIRGGAFPGSERWFVTDMHPGRHPFEELDAALMRVAVQPPAGLLARLESGPRGLVEVTNAIVPNETELLLVVDQFEEAFTLTENEEERALLLESLRVATADPASRVNVVTTLRADFYDRPLRYPRMGPLLGSTTEVLSPLTPEELERAIVRPAERSGLAVDSALVPQIAADVAEQPGALPLVQYALTELYDRRDDGRLTVEAYREIGGVGGALAASAEHLYATRNEERREAVRQLFLRLVTLGEGTADTRRRVRLSELSALEVDANAMESALDAYGRHRLLTFDRDPSTREPTVEVAHEALLGAWERLGGWIDQAREDVRMHRRLSTAAGEWESSGLEASFLLSGSRLDQFEAWGSSTSLALGLEERGYLSASVARREEEHAEEAARRDRERALERRSVKRLRTLVAVFAAAALVAASLTVLAKNQSDRAGRESRIATARELAAASAASLGQDVQRSLLLAIRAVDTTHSVDGSVLPEAEEALHAAIQADRVVRTFQGGAAVRYSPDGSRILTPGKAAGTALVYEADTGRLVMTLKKEPADSVLDHVNYSPDGRFISTAGGGPATTVLWNAETGEKLGKLQSSRGWGLCCATEFTPDGNVAAVCETPGVRSNREDTGLFDTETRQQIGDVDGCGSIGFSPDGIHFWVNNCVVNWRDPADGERCVPEPKEGVRDLSVSRAGDRVALAAGDGTLSIWDTHSLQNVTTLAPGVPGFPWDIEFSPDGSRIAMGFSDGSVHIWTLSGRSAAEALVLNEHGAAVQSMKFSPDGRYLATAGFDQLVTIWDVSTTGGAESLAVAGAEPGQGAFAYDPTGTRIAVGQGSQIRIVEADSGATVQTLRTDGTVQAIAFDAIGKHVAAGADGGEVDVWDIETGEHLFSRRVRFDVVSGVTFSPDGRSLAGFAFNWHCGTEAYLWSVPSGRNVRSFRSVFNCEPNSSTSFSPDGKMLALQGDDRRVALWNMVTGARVGGLRTQEGVLSHALSPEGSTLAAGDQDGRLELWDVRTGRRVETLTGNLSDVWSVAYSPDGRFLATASGDGSVRVWDVDAGRELYTVATTEAGPWFKVAFSPDGTHLAAPMADGTLRVFILPIDELLRLARSRVQRDFTEQECRQYLHVPSCAAA